MMDECQNCEEPKIIVSILNSQGHNLNLDKNCPVAKVKTQDSNLFPNLTLKVIVTIKIQEHNQLSMASDAGNGLFTSLKQH